MNVFQHLYKRVLNIDVLNMDSSSLLELFTSGCLFTPNIDHFVLLQDDRDLYLAYRSAEFVVLDSRVLYLLSQLTKDPFIGHIAGSDFFPQYCDYHKGDPSIRIFILGGMGTTSLDVQRIINSKYQREIVVGAYSPPLNFETIPGENESIVNMINDSHANVLVVGLGTPKQEKWIHENRRIVPEVHSLMGVGATLDFIAGNQHRAPMWMRKAGFEWLFRLFLDPVRLVKRYLIRDVRIFYYLIKDMFNYYTNPFENDKENL